MMFNPTIASVDSGDLLMGLKTAQVVQQAQQER
jgi:hypothetical protein